VTHVKYVQCTIRLDANKAWAKDLPLHDPFRGRCWEAACTFTSFVIRRYVDTFIPEYLQIDNERFVDKFSKGLNSLTDPRYQSCWTCRYFWWSDEKLTPFCIDEEIVKALAVCESSWHDPSGIASEIVSISPDRPIPIRPWLHPNLLLSRFLLFRMSPLYVAQCLTILGH